MLSAESSRLISFSFIAFLAACCGLHAQRSGKSKTSISPLSGHDFIGGYVGGNLTIAPVDPGLIPVPDNSFTLSAPGGAGFEFGLSYGRLMPALFVSTSTTAELRLLYTRLIETASGSGFVAAPEQNGTGDDVLVQQSTTIMTTIAAAQLRFSFDTRPMANASPTILLAATFGHIADMNYETLYDPEGIVENGSDGIPKGGRLPERRWFYAALHIGGGGRINLGDPADSPAIVPELELMIPLTSLARYADWTPFGVRGSLGLRWPL